MASTFDRFRVSWLLNGQEIERNASLLRAVPDRVVDDRTMTNMSRKLISARRASDPRTLMTHSLELAFFRVSKLVINFFEDNYYFHRPAFPMKFYQHDFPNLYSPADLTEATPLLPANYPIVGTCVNWYVRRRGISDDAGDGPYLYRNGTLVESGITWDYAEGMVTFDVAIPTSDTVQAFYRWKPLVKVVGMDHNPVPGKPHDDPRYDCTVQLKQV